MMPAEIEVVNIVFMKFHRKTKILQELDQKLTMLHSGGKKSGYILSENFNEAEFKSNEPICLEKETSRYPSIQVTAWVVLIAFSLQEL